MPGVDPGVGPFGRDRAGAGQIQVHLGDPTGAIGSRAADDVGAVTTTQQSVIRRREDGYLRVVYVHENGEAAGNILCSIVNLVRQTGDHLARVAGAVPDVNGDGGADRLPQLEFIITGKGPGQAITAGRWWLCRWRPVALHVAALVDIQEIRQAKL